MTAALIVLATANVAMAAVLVFAYRAQTRQMESLTRAVVSKHAGEFAGIERAVGIRQTVESSGDQEHHGWPDVKARLERSLEDQPQPGVPVGFDGT